jgi:hypothetical protein
MAYASALYTSASGTTFALTNSDGDAIEYLKQNDIAVYVNDVLQTVTTDYTFNSAGTAIVLNTAVSGAEVYIIRTTDISEPVVNFTAGSTLTSTDLNNSNEQYRFALQEFRDTYAALTEGTEDLGEFPGIIDSTEAWISDDSHWPTTATLDNRFVDQLNDETIAGVKTFSSSPVVPTPTSGTDATNKDYVDDNHWDVDGETINTAEQTAQVIAWDDTKIATAGAISTRHDLVISGSEPTTTQPGKLWYDNTSGATALKLYDGSGWQTITSGNPYIPTGNTIIRYVDATNGSDAVSVTGYLPQAPLQSIKRAVELVNADGADGTLIVVAPGVYQETLPIQIQRVNVSIVGSALRSCFVQPTQATETNTMFEVNSGTLLANMTFVGLKASGTAGGNAVDPGTTYGLPTNQGWAVAFYNNASIKKSPYIQNCTNFADSGIDNSVKYDQTNLPGSGLGGDQTSAATGGGILIDGNTPISTSPLRSMVVDSFTQILLNGPGVLCTNDGYAQLVSFFGTFCRYHAKALNGGQLNLSNCTTDFGEYGLIADGKSPTNIFTSTANGATTTADTWFLINATTADAGWHGDQTNPRPQDNMLVQIGGNADGTGGTIYPVTQADVSGSGWKVYISNPNPLNYSDNLGLSAGFADGTTIRFFLRSMISTGGHTFEYVGSGTDYRALPDYGGVAVEANQVKDLNNGKVWQSSTDHNGKFKVGDTFEVDQQTGFVTIDPGASSFVTKTAITGSAALPVGTTAQRDGSPSAGYIRFNSTDSSFEGYDGSAWGAIGGGGATPAGVAGSIQINDGAGALGAVTDFKWDSANTELDVPGDISLDDGGTYTTTIQSITATADRFISFPDATGVVGLVQGTNGALQYNNAGVQGGATDTSVGTSGDITIGANGAASTPPVKLDGTWFSGGTSTTTKPQLLIEPSGSTSTAWSTGGTGLGVNAASGFAGNLLDLQVNGTSKVVTDSSGRLLVGTSSARTNFSNSTDDPQLQIESSNGFGWASIRNSNSSGGAYVYIAKSRGTGNVVLQNNDVIGGLNFEGNDGSEFVTAAQVRAEIDGTPSANDMPGRLVFSTTADGASSPTERMRISSSGIVQSLGVYNETTGNAANMNVSSLGTIQRSTSSIKYKTQVEDLDETYADALLECRPVWYRSTCAADDPTHSYWGFIAEEVAEIDPRLVHWKTTEPVVQENGSIEHTPCEPEPEGVAYDRFVPHLLNLIKRQKEQIETLEARVATLEGN